MQLRLILATLALLSSLTHSVVVDTAYVTTTNYSSRVYCPLSSTNTKKYLLQNLQFFDFPANLNTHNKKHLEYEQNYEIQSYIIVVQWRKLKNNKHGKFVMCSFVRDWLGNCDEPRVECHGPGPAFVVERNKKVDVAWIYDIVTDREVTFRKANVKACCYRMHEPFDNIKQHCASPEAILLQCIEDVKPVGNQKCTYFDIMDLKGPINKTLINESNPLLGIHVHGLQSRPTFDGNPYSFMAKNGTLGVGFQSLLNKEYYKQFSQQLQPTELHFDTNQIPLVKVNRYYNFQYPGTLWYHDHSMHVSYPNVALGMFGMYIIRDSSIEAKLPAGQYEILLPLMTFFIDNNDNQVRDKNITRTHHVQYRSNQSILLQRNQTYRFRILEGNYGSSLERVSFLTQCNISQSSVDYNFDSCKKLKFSVIGADNNLFAEPVHDLELFDLYIGERIDILIVFDGELQGKKINAIPEGERLIWLATNSSLYESYVNMGFYLEPKTSERPNNAKFPGEYQVFADIDFVDLREINHTCTEVDLLSPLTSTKCISQTKFKPLLKDAAVNMVINARFFDLNGRSLDHPTVGTTEDWYFGNFFISPDVPHALHVHLSDSQIISKGKLKRVPGELPDLAQPDFTATCAYYEIDYYLNIGIIKNDSDYTLLQLCQRIRILKFKDMNMTDAYREDVSDDNHVSGFSMITKMTDQEIKDKLYFDPECPNSTYKYICNNTQVIPRDKLKWKDTVPINVLEFVQIRIRWTSTHYNPDKKVYPFYNVPEDQLIEFPGYLYHCHFLRHQDFDQMLSFSMNPSPYFKDLFSVAVKSPLGRCMMQNSGNVSAGWQGRFGCINKGLGCKEEVDNSTLLDYEQILSEYENEQTVSSNTTASQVDTASK